MKTTKLTWTAIVTRAAITVGLVAVTVFSGNVPLVGVLSTMVVTPLLYLTWSTK